MTSPHTTNLADDYAAAILKVVQAENVQDEVEQQLKNFAGILQQNQELKTTLADHKIDVEHRSMIIKDLLDGKMEPTTVALLGMIIEVGRGNELAEILDTFIDHAAAGRNRKVARVRSAQPLSDEQKTRLAEALKTSMGLDVEVHATVDPTMIGGVITEIGDNIIDGSIRNRLRQMRNSVK